MGKIYKMMLDVKWLGLLPCQQYSCLNRLLCESIPAKRLFVYRLINDRHISYIIEYINILMSKAVVVYGID